MTTRRIEEKTFLIALWNFVTNVSLGMPSFIYMEITHPKLLFLKKKKKKKTGHHPPSFKYEGMEVAS